MDSLLKLLPYILVGGLAAILTAVATTISVLYLLGWQKRKLVSEVKKTDTETKLTDVKIRAERISVSVMEGNEVEEIVDKLIRKNKMVLELQDTCDTQARQIKDLTEREHKFEAETVRLCAELKNANEQINSLLEQLSKANETIRKKDDEKAGLRIEIDGLRAEVERLKTIMTEHNIPIV